MDSFCALVLQLLVTCREYGSLFRLLVNSSKWHEETEEMPIVLVTLRSIKQWKGVK